MKYTNNQIIVECEGICDLLSMMGFFNKYSPLDCIPDPDLLYDAVLDQLEQKNDDTSHLLVEFLCNYKSKAWPILEHALLTEIFEQESTRNFFLAEKAVKNLVTEKT